MACNMTSGYNDRTCTNGKGGIKSVLFFPVANLTVTTKTANEITAWSISGETFHYKLKSNLSSYTAPIQRNEENGTLWCACDPPIPARSVLRSGIPSTGRYTPDYTKK